MNPAPPSFHATIKLHKHNMPIRPVINWKNAPAYQLAKHLAKMLHNNLHLPYTYNIQNSTQLIAELNTIEISKDTRMCSFDITNMYTIIPRVESTNIIANILERNSNIGDNNQKEIIHMLQTTMEQNYFQFKQKFYKQTDGLAMGAPTSAITSEAYIQNMEHKQIFPILVKHQIAGYFRYDDNILIIYNQAKTNRDQIHAAFNEQPTNHKIHDRKRITQLHQIPRPDNTPQQKRI
jgi:hypothetical protein